MFEAEVVGGLVKAGEAENREPLPVFAFDFFQRFHEQAGGDEDDEKDEGARPGLAELGEGSLHEF